MDKELKDKALEIITSLQDIAREGAAQLPEMATSYVAYGRAAETISAFLLFALFVFCAWRVYLAFKNPKLVGGTGYDKAEWAPAQIAETFSCVMILFLSAPFLLSSVRRALFVWVAPKVWLIKELSVLF